jgi:hypothetical protein
MHDILWYFLFLRLPSEAIIASVTSHDCYCLAMVPPQASSSRGSEMPDRARTPHQSSVNLPHNTFPTFPPFSGGTRHENSDSSTLHTPFNDSDASYFSSSSWSQNRVQRPSYSLIDSSVSFFGGFNPVLGAYFRH